ncbi:tetratricopeptide repeat-containing hybrid sensor histidine kinase/response regulator [Mesonia maritima]|uniref:histidine kinase n=1 Tax=Mesonia maritima TaxID=1793873 RepID=A0ABU1K966_9FLAO|nr:response regulator [Mesonia maritima]MDR6302153.1 signal transduction histidine kinase/BarA-like signal transduction histidine kinase [Mesonia maritima]
MKGLTHFILILLLTNSLFAQQEVSRDTLHKYLDEAYTYFDETNIKESVKIGRKLLKLAHQANDDLFIAEAYYLLALNDETARNYTQAEEKYIKALEKVKKVKDSSFLVLLYNGLGNVAAINKHKYKESEIYYQKGLRISKKINDPYRIAIIANLCWNYLDNDKPKKVTPYIEELKDYLAHPKDDFNRNHFIANINQVLGRYYSQLKQYDLSKVYFDNSIKVSEEHKMWTELKNVYEYRSVSNEQQGRYKEAINDLRKYIEYKDVYLNEHNLEQLKKEEARLDLQEYQRELKTVERERKLLTSVAETKNKLLWVYGIIFLILLTFFVLFFRQYQAKKRFINKLNIKNEELQEAKKEAEIAAEIKKQFISNISHEIRTPLHGVVGITSLLLAQPEISEDNKQLLTSLKFSGDYLLSLINNVLLMSKIDNDKIKVQPKLINIETLTTNILYSVQFQAEKNHSNVIIDVAEDVPPQIIADDSILFEILINLIENGIKFCKNGKVTLKIEKLQQESEAISLRFSVIDNGMGIPEDKKEMVFEKFSQVSLDKSIMEGTGIGLSIVRSLLLLLDSDIHLESEEGIGSTFYFDLKCKLAEDSTHVLNGSELAQDVYKDKKILLVEDNEINKMVIRKYLGSYEFDLEIVSDGVEGFSAIEKNNYDLILLDINIPSMNGFDIAKKTRERGIKTPIIAVTASELTEVENNVKKNGMNDVLIKPFSKEKLLQIIQTYLS